MLSTRVVLATSVVSMAILACSLGTGAAGPQPDLPATITAQALTLAAPVSTNEPVATPTDSGVHVRVTSDTNCRTGPAQVYDQVFVAHPEQSFKVLGKNSSTNYWIVENAAGGSCWLWGKYAVLTGDAGSLPEFPAPPTPVPPVTKTPKPTKTVDPASLLPSAPFGLGANGYSCDMYLEGMVPKWRESFTLIWSDTSDNEQGFGVYQNDMLVATLPKNTETYSTELKYVYNPGSNPYDNWAVEAFNVAGSSQRAELEIRSCNNPGPSS